VDRAGPCVGWDGEGPLPKHQHTESAAAAAGVEGVSAAELELVLQTVRVGTWRMDPVTRALSFSRTMAPLHGLAPSETPASYEQYLELVHPSDREPLSAAVDAALRDGDPYELEVRVVWPDGSHHWLAVEGRLVEPGGRPMLVGIARDIDRAHAVIDELVEAHRAGEEARALIDAVYASAPVGLAFTDTSLRYVRVNDAMARINGIPAREHIGRRPSDLVGGPDGAGVEELMRRTIESQEAIADVELEDTRPARRETARSYTASLVPVRSVSGRVVGLGVAISDVTDRVAADRRRERVLEQARFLAEASAALDESLDLDRTLSAVADIAVQHIADWCSIDLGEPGGQIQNVAVAHVDPEKLALARDLQRRYPPRQHDVPVGAANVILTGEPELYGSIQAEVLEAATVDEEHLAMIHSLDLASAMVLPLRARSGTFGALTLIRTSGREPFCEEDVPFALEIARRAALAVDNARLYGEAREQRDLYEALLRAQSDLGEGFVLIEGQRIVYVNEAAERITGRTAQELCALRSFLDLLPEERHGAVGRRLARVSSSETVEPGFETELLRPDGSRIPLEVAAKPLGEGSERIVVIARDISERKQQEEERQMLLAVEQAARRATQAAHERQRMLADASALLERSLSLQDTLQAVAELIVARLAHGCTIDVRGRDGTMSRLGAASRGPNGRQMLLLLAAQTGLATRREGLIGETMRVGQPRFIDDPAVRIRARVGAAAGSEEALRQAIGSSAVVLPLVARGRAVGALSLGWAEPAHRPDREEWTLIEALTQRIALAVDGALQFEERAHVARTLQASLLPPSLPELPGAEAAGHYAAAGEGIEVGGDFYDLFHLGEGRWALVVGDVCGKGAEAAAVTALARYTLRAVGGPSSRPDVLLETLNRALRRQYREPPFVTAVVGVLELGTGEAPARLTIAAAGHPPPIVLRRRGGGEVLDTHGRLVGVTDRVDAVVAETALEPGDAIVLYTDGVTEARRPAPITPEELLAALLPHAGRGAGAIAQALTQLAEAAAPGGLRDDVAILAVRIATPTLLPTSRG
jgi:PAS domain S-box-containing protein